jgi:WD40 repeat protein
MKSLNKKPVVFLAFANDRVRPGAYLRNLPEELRCIRDALTEAVKAGICELVERANATLEDIIDVFQDRTYKDRIAIFHYGGHADSFKLLLESPYGGPSSAYKEGLAPFLGRRNSLKLVFLNACSTQQHALELNRAGVPLVIATSQDIFDGTALQLADRFYNGMGNGLPLERAWREARDEIITRTGESNTSAMYQDGKATDDERFPWQFYYKEGAESVSQWNLPDAAHDPLFGLPPIPQTYPLPQSPYFFLGRFRREHAPLFFGRSHYIRALYNRVTHENAAPVILLFGQSGAGKSSLLEAGLLPRLEQSHTCLYLRRSRETGLSGTLHQALNRLITGLSNPLPFQLDCATIPDKWQWLESGNRPPLLVILDQVEEAYTSFNPDLPHEVACFLEDINPLFRTPITYPRGKLILGYRKEYHPEIEEQLKECQIPHAAEFLQPLDRDGIVEVVTGLTRTPRLTRQYNLEIEETLPVIIADDLTEDPYSPVAPTLQIILTKMWETPKPDPYSTRRFFRVHRYQELRKTGLLMEDFFKEQMEALHRWNPESVDSGLVLDLLEFHTTPLGTACSRSIHEIRHNYSHSDNIIDSLVGKLKSLYLLTDTYAAGPVKDQTHNKKTSLAHDTLAPIVIDQYNRSPFPGQRAARILAAKLGDSNPGTRPLWLDETDLKVVEEGQSGMKVLTPEGTRLLEESRKRKARRERRIRRNQIIRKVLSIMVFLIALVALWQWNQAYIKEKKATANFYASRAQLTANQDPTIALRLAEQAFKMDNNPIVKKSIYKIYRENSFYKILAAQANAVTSLAVSPDGTKVVIGSPDGVVSLWDCRGKIIRTFKAHKSFVLSAAFSPGSNYILTGSMDRTARLWNLEGKKLRELSGHGGFVLSVTFSPDDRHILTGSVDDIARLWNRQGKLLREIRGHEGGIFGVSFSHDSKFILTGSSDGSARIWDLDGNQIKVFNVPDSSVTSGAFSPDGKFIVVGCSNGKALLWNIKKDELKEFPSHKQRVTSVSFSPNGRYILTASEDNTARLWDVNGTLLQVFKGHRDKVVSAAFSPDGKYVFTGSKDKTLRLWALKGRMAAEFDGHNDRVYDVAFSPDGSHVLTGSGDRTARLWDLKGKQLFNKMNHDGSVLTVGFSPDGKGIFTRTENGKTYWWDLKGNPLNGLSRERNLAPSNVIAPMGKYRFNCLEDGTVQLFDSAGNHFQTFTGHKGNVKDVDFSPDGKYMLTGSFDNTARLWEIPMSLQDFLKSGVCEQFSEKELKEYGIEEK